MFNISFHQWFGQNAIDQHFRKYALLLSRQELRPLHTGSVTNEPHENAKYSLTNKILYIIGFYFER